MTVALVTGAGRGIGRATALALAARGVDLALVGLTADNLAETAKLARARGVRVETFPCDVGDAGRVEATARAVEAVLGAPDVVVHSAGIARRVSVEATSDEDWSATLAANLSGPFFVTRALLPSMRARGSGRFVFVASISSTLGTPRLSAYCASKWGVVGFAKSLAEELRGSGLSALSVLPGSVDTDMLAGSGFPPQMGPDEVARTIVFLALDAPASMNSSAVEMFGP